MKHTHATASSHTHLTSIKDTDGGPRLWGDLQSHLSAPLLEKKEKEGGGPKLLKNWGFSDSYKLIRTQAARHDLSRWAPDVFNMCISFFFTKIIRIWFWNLVDPFYSKQNNLFDLDYIFSMFDWAMVQLIWWHMMYFQETGRTVKTKGNGKEIWIDGWVVSQGFVVYIFLFYQPSCNQTSPGPILLENTIKNK